ncbi:MAG: cell division protein FtsQ/DivIB [Thermodesulfobacteriota bacterium]
MKSVLAHQVVRKDRKKDLVVFKRALGQLGFGLIKMFLFLLCLGLVSVSLVSGYRFLSSSRWFKVQDIVVAGVGESMKHAVIDLSGVTDEDTLLSIDTAAIEENIKKHPWIKGVSVTRTFPHTLNIEVHREKPVAVVVLDRMCLMNREGVLFKEIGKNDPIDFPFITGLKKNDEQLSGRLSKVASFLAAYWASREVLPVREISEIHVEKYGDLCVYFNNLPFKVSFGNDEFTRKIDSLQQIIKHLRTTQRLDRTRSIDMDYPDRGVVKLADQVV